MMGHALLQSPIPIAFRNKNDMQKIKWIKTGYKRQCSIVVGAQRPTLETEVPRIDPALDDELSKRPLNLDAAGYFIIKIDRDANVIVADYYTNTINKNGETAKFRR